MMSEQGVPQVPCKVLVLDGDASARKDIETSLSGLGLDLDFKGEVIEAYEALKTDHFDILLVRAVVFGTSASEFVEGAKLQGCLDGVRVIAMFEEVEEPLIKGSEAMFDKMVLLPVEFPTFANQILEVVEVVRANSDLGEVSFEGEPGNAPEIESPSVLNSQTNEESTEDFVMDKRLVVVASLHLKVLDALRNSTEFVSTPLMDIPELLSKTTKQICDNCIIKV